MLIFKKNLQKSTSIDQRITILIEKEYSCTRDKENASFKTSNITKRKRGSYFFEFVGTKELQ